MNKFLSLTILIVFCFMLSNCVGTGTKNYWVDNPTEKEIEIMIDETKYTIPAQSGLSVPIELGRHKLSYNNESLNFFAKKSDIDVFINPTLSNYVLYQVIFINENDERATDSMKDWLWQQSLHETSLIINGDTVLSEVPFRVINDLFIERVRYPWDYGLTQELPESVMFTRPTVTRRNKQLLNDRNYQAGKFQESKRKIFSEGKFMEYMKSKYEGDELDFRLVHTNRSFSDEPVFTLETVNVDEIKNTEGKEFLQNKIKEINDWLAMKGAAVANKQDETIGVKSQISISELSNKVLTADSKDFSFNAASNQLSEKTNSIIMLNFVVVR